MPRYAGDSKLHLVNKTRLDHTCRTCDVLIPKGSMARYRNTFTGQRDYYHFPECPRFARGALTDCRCYAKCSDPARKEMLERIFPGGLVPVQGPFVRAGRVGCREFLCYDVDLARVTPEEVRRLVVETSAAFGLAPDQVEEDLDLVGAPLLAEDVMVVWCPRHARLVRSETEEQSC